MIPSRHDVSGRWSESGQGLTEYIILVGLIALVVYGVVQTMGTNIKGTFTAADTKISGIQDGWGGSE